MWLIFVIFTYFGSTLSSPVACKLSDVDSNLPHVDLWTCRQNEDSSFNVEFDCFQNHLMQDLAIDLKQFPQKVKSVTLQNCEQLKLTIHQNESSSDSLRELTLRNIKNLELLNGFEGKESSSKRKFWTLTKVQVENVGLRRIEKGTIDISTDDGVLEIKNSSFKMIDKEAILFRGSQAFFIGNTFERIPGRGISIFTQNFSFKGNIVDELESLAVSGQNIKFEDNIIKFQKTGAFRFSTGSPKNMTDFPGPILNISNNEFHYLEPSSFELPSIHHQYFLDTFVFKGNKINCSCRNEDWFLDIATLDMEQDKFFYQKITDGSNGNKCLKTGCQLSHALQNFAEFCIDEEKCSEEGHSDISGIADGLALELEILRKLQGSGGNFSESISILNSHVKRLKSVAKRVEDRKPVNFFPDWFLVILCFVISASALYVLQGLCRKEYHKDNRRVWKSKLRSKWKAPARQRETDASDAMFKEKAQLTFGSSASFL